MRTPVRILLAPAALAATVAVAGCGGGEGDLACSGMVCTVESSGAGTFELDELGTEIRLSDLRSDSVRVRVNSEARTLRRGADPVRMRGFLVSAQETSAERAKVRIER